MSKKLDWSGTSRGCTGELDIATLLLLGLALRTGGKHASIWLKRMYLLENFGEVILQRLLCLWTGEDCVNEIYGMLQWQASDHIKLLTFLVHLVVHPGILKPHFQLVLMKTLLWFIIVEINQKRKLV